MKSNGQKGVTLIELLIAISLFSIIIVLAGSLFFTGFRGYINNTERIAGQSGVRLALFEINNALRLAKPADVAIQNSGNTIVIGTTTYSFSIDPLDEYGTITKTTGSDSYQLAGNIKDFDASIDGDIVAISLKSKWEDSHVSTKLFIGVVPTPSPTPLN